MAGKQVDKLEHLFYNHCAARDFCREFLLHFLSNLKNRIFKSRHKIFFSCHIIPEGDTVPAEGSGQWSQCHCGRKDGCSSVVPQEQPPVLRPPSPVFCTVPVCLSERARGIRSSRIKKKTHEFRTLNRSGKVSGPSRPKVPANGPGAFPANGPSAFLANGPSAFLGERARGFVCFA